MIGIKISTHRADEDKYENRSLSIDNQILIVHKTTSKADKSWVKVQSEYKKSLSINEEAQIRDFIKSSSLYGKNERYDIHPEESDGEFITISIYNGKDNNEIYLHNYKDAAINDLINWINKYVDNKNFRLFESTGGHFEFSEDIAEK